MFFPFIFKINPEKLIFKTTQTYIVGTKEKQYFYDSNIDP